MQTPLRITFRHMDSSAAVEAGVQELMQRLERLHGAIVGCHVVIESRRNNGAPFAVKIDLTVPGREIFVTSERADQAAHSDVYVALRDAFDSVKRALQDYEGARRAVKFRPKPIVQSH